MPRKVECMRTLKYGQDRVDACCKPIRITMYKRNYVTSINMDTSHGARVREKTTSPNSAR